MEAQTPLVEVLLENKDKILENKKYNEAEFEDFINSLIEAENLRKDILIKIKNRGEFDINKLKEEFDISDHDLVLNFIYLKELGLLEPFGEISRFYQSI